MTRFQNLLRWAPLGLVSAIACSSATAGALDDIHARGRLIVGVKTDYRPLGFLDENGRNAGVEVELARFIAGNVLGDSSKVEFVPVVFKNRVDYLLSGKIDLILATMVTTPERLKIVDASIPYLRPGGGTLLAPKAGPVTSWETTRGHNICGIEASYFNPTLISRFGAKVTEYPDADQAYQALADGKCTGFAFDEILLRMKIRDPQWSAFAIVGEPLQMNGFQIGLRKGDEAFRATLDTLILEAQAEGKMVQWEAKYGMDIDPWSLEQVQVATKKLAGD
ncbi:transporter substrate-binding domain-containing protein [Bradyrhizobium sp. 6(2017)]|uniref:transporter substrate-binding domain-containing protein n=1 Tax=Bradyrhizobium sp. 6(2017) TaxID=1197460 RepID=UPI0013E1B23B|nr:transporter substrate-binding domain-containing protein [Bradyrhizobium sp. 6(2017)]QIG97678.1 transporter substrate-binding domain-containing protein [Bradyrhizobium sp. 6(2017)]